MTLSPLNPFSKLLTSYRCTLTRNPLIFQKVPLPQNFNQIAQHICLDRVYNLQAQENPGLRLYQYKNKQTSYCELPESIKSILPKIFNNLIERNNTRLILNIKIIENPNPLPTRNQTFYIPPHSDDNQLTFFMRQSYITPKSEQGYHYDEIIFPIFSATPLLGNQFSFNLEDKNTSNIQKVNLNTNGVIFDPRKTHWVKGCLLPQSLALSIALSIPLNP